MTRNPSAVTGPRRKQTHDQYQRSARRQNGRHSGSGKVALDTQRMDWADERAEIRQRYKIEAAWVDLGLEGPPPRRGKKVCSPFRPDRKPSCSATPDGNVFKDWSTGESWDVFAFVKEATGWEWLQVFEWTVAKAGVTRKEVVIL